MLSRLFCWLWGHAWRVIQESGGPNPMSHVPLLCDRCGRSTICIPGLMDGREPAPDPPKEKQTTPECLERQIDSLRTVVHHNDLRLGKLEDIDREHRPAFHALYQCVAQLEQRVNEHTVGKANSFEVSKLNENTNLRIAGLEAQVWKYHEDAKQEVCSLSQDIQVKLDNLAADLDTLRGAFAEHASSHGPGATIGWSSETRKRRRLQPGDDVQGG